MLKIINDLSGGEKARLQLALLMLQKDNVLILDEPTNHLDIDSKEMLEQALKHFEGTIIFVSHDRYFINQLANKVFDLNHEGGQIYLGDYQYYIEKTEETAALKAQEELKNSSSKPITIMTLLFLLQHIQVKNNRKVINVKSNVRLNNVKLRLKNLKLIFLILKHN